MAAHLQRAIDNLMKELVSLSAWVEESVKRSVTALQTEDSSLRLKLLKLIKDDEKIDSKEIDIEEECLKIFALHQPVAIDLRYLVAALKINNDLERIGDLAVNIARCSLLIMKDPVRLQNFDIRKMYRNVRSMLKKSLDSMVNLDADLAYEVLKADDEVDRQHNFHSSEILEHIKTNPTKAEELIQYIHITRHLERIADHTTNIAEDIIYLIKGEIVRHGS